MKQVLNPDIPRYIAWEDGISLHRLLRRDDNNKFYYTRCNIPIAFEEDWTTHKGVTPYRYICDICGPIT